MDRVVHTGRRDFIWGALAAATTAATVARPAAASKSEIRFGLTPVFLSDDLDLLARLKAFLERTTGMRVALVQRRTYEEITSLLLSGQLTAAWICGYPYIQYRNELSLVAVPVWHGKPKYQSYLITARSRTAHALCDLRGDTHAFSDPNSNSGYLVTSAMLARIGLRPDQFFRKTFFTYGHRNVVRAVAAGLAQSGSVDGYVWQVLSETEPRLTEGTRIVSRSQWLGFPPIAALQSQANSPQVEAVSRALTTMSEDPDGSAVLRLLRLDGFTKSKTDLFDGIAHLVEIVRRLG